KDAEGYSIIQLREYRIIITKPPMSDGYEITIVKPLIKKNLTEYNISQELMNRIDSKAEGILICGSPGMGKSTFACALAEYYSKKNKIVKTIESPRDLQVWKEITQYGLNEDSYDAISDIILLARPDYCIFDELRKTKDFEIFTDLRLAGIGLIGVVHATEPIDAIQRFIGRVDLGMIPQILDTIIYIHSGKIKKVYYLNYTVKIPSGMFEKDLARPVIEVINAENKTIEYEIYTFGEETVVIPTDKSASNFEQKLKSFERTLEKLLKRNFHIEVENNIIKLYVNSKDRHKVLGKKGSRINELEKIIGMRIEVISNE
ncbi:MAG: ATPase, T2SS/T4P/T4SS family, partial [Candidatus Aenigmatarchaeota archaeon]